MSAAAPQSTDDRTLSGIISDMEVDVRDLHAWCLTIRALGARKVPLEPEILEVLGRAMLTSADDHLIDWTRAFKLTRETGGDR